jgi:hypothetical protein
MTRVGWNPTFSANLTKDNMNNMKQYVICDGNLNVRKLQESNIAYKKLSDGTYLIIKDRIESRLDQILTYEELVLELL